MKHAALVVKRRDGVRPEPKSVGAKDIQRGERCADRTGNGSNQRAQDQNVACVICSAHDGQTERMLTAFDLVLVEPLRGMWMDVANLVCTSHFNTATGH